MFGFIKKTVYYSNWVYWIKCKREFIELSFIEMCFNKKLRI